MFAFLTRRKAAGVAAGAEDAARNLSAANARRKRVFDRTVMSPDVVLPVIVPIGPREFGLKPADD